MGGQYLSSDVLPKKGKYGTLNRVGESALTGILIREREGEAMREMKRFEQVNWVFLVTVLFYIGASMALSGWLAQTENLVLRLGVSQLILAIPTMGYLCMSGTPIREGIRFKPLKFSRILWIVLLAELLLPLVMFVNSLSMLFTENVVANNMGDLANLPLAAGLMMAAAIPAFLEESIYRGLFYNEYRKTGIWRGIILSSLLFALMHLNLNQFCYAFVMALIFGIVLEVTDSILSVMIIHFWINASSVLTIHLDKMSQLIYGTESVEAVADITLKEVYQLGSVAIIPTALAALVLFKLAKLENRTHIWGELFPRKADRKKEEKSRLFTLPLIAGILICLGYMIMYEIILRGVQ